MDQERTFTQAEVNKMIQTRLAEEKQKIQQQSEAAFAEREKDLAARERKLSAREKIRAAGLPDDLADVLDISTDEALSKGIEALNRIYNKPQPETTIRGAEVANPPLVNQNSKDELLEKAFGLRQSKG